MKNGFRLPFSIGFCILAAVAAFFLWEEHRAHILRALPCILLLLYPLSHFLMHRGHGGHGHKVHGREGGQP